MAFDTTNADEILKSLDHARIASILGSTVSLTVELDADDLRAVQEEFRERAKSAKAMGLTDIILPDGESNVLGSLFGECVRSLQEYRELADSRRAETT